MSRCGQHRRLLPQGIEQELELIKRLLPDLNIAIAFDLYNQMFSSEDEQERLILDTLINQKLVIGLTREDLSLPRDDLEAAFALLVEKLGRPVLDSRLDQFGLEDEDVKEYLREKLLYRKIIQERFGLGTIVSLKEMEDHYRQIYLPSQESRGIAPLPLMEILDEIEAVIRSKKIDRQVEEWISSLKRGADIRILRKEKEL